MARNRASRRTQSKLWLKLRAELPDYVTHHSVTELMNYPDAVREFARYVARPAEEIRLDEAALLLARTEYPALDLPAQLARLDALAARAKCAPSQSPHANIASLNRLLFEEETFAGNEEI